VIGRTILKHISQSRLRRCGMD